MAMTFDEVKRGAAELSEEERWQLSAFLKHLARADSPENRAELSRIHRAMDEGKRVTQEQWQEHLSKLEAEGR